MHLLGQKITICDIGKDEFTNIEDIDILQFVKLSLDKLDDLKYVSFFILFLFL